MMGVALGLAAIVDGPASAKTTPDAGVLDEVVVTAQRRAELSQDVPVSLTVLSGEALKRLQATEMARLGKVVPSLVMMRTGAFTQPYLRGVGKRSTLGVENSVATYVDGVYMASSISALLDLRGVERVEVLNGPQGTLFGRNSTGGVIQMVTRDPQRETSGEAEFHLGSYGYGRGDGYLSGGNDRLAANLAVSLSRTGGYGRNEYDGQSSQGEVTHSFVARNKWIWRPADVVKLTLAADYQDVDQDYAQRPVEGFAPIGQPRVTGFRDGDQDWSNRQRFQYGGGSVRADFALGGVIFTSLSAARRMKARYSADLDEGPHLLISADVNADQRQLTQEFQLQPTGPARAPWIAGLYLIHIEERYEPTTFHYGGAYSAQRGGRTGQSLSDTGKVAAYALYGQATWPLGGKTQLTTGLRYTTEKRSVEAQGEQLYDNAPFVRPIPGLPLIGQAPFSNNKTIHEPSWRISLNRDLSATLMGYVSASRGFQSGGWNLQTPQNPAFGPESLVSLEGGLKYLDRSERFRADASVFYYDYSDLQVSAFTALGSVTTNATSADIYGLEIQVQARPQPVTDVTFGAQWLEARFDSFPNATCTNYSSGAAVAYAPMVCDATGNRLPFAPRLKFNLGLIHEAYSGSAGDLVLSGNLAFNSGHFSEVDNVVRQERFATLDVKAEWRLAERAASVQIWALNLADIRYYDTLVTFPTAGVFQRPGAPRRFGASVIYAF